MLIAHAISIVINRMKPYQTNTTPKLTNDIVSDHKITWLKIKIAHKFA